MKKTVRLFGLLLCAALLVGLASGCGKGVELPGVTGDDGKEYVAFGHWPEGKEIEWIVLDEKDGAKLLLSRYNLDTGSYHTDYVPVTWETSYLREWMNTWFYDEAFSDEEKKRIRTTKLKNEDNSYGTPGGNDTEDNVFSLSYAELNQYFSTGTDENGDPVYDAERMRTTCIEDLRPQYFYEGDEVPAEIEDPDYFWLRTPGSIQESYAMCIWPDGYVSTTGDAVFRTRGYRPAIWVK